MKNNITAFNVIPAYTSAALSRLPESFLETSFKIDFSQIFIRLKCALYSGSGFALNPGYGKIVSIAVMANGFNFGNSSSRVFVLSGKFTGLHFQAVAVAE